MLPKDTKKNWHHVIDSRVGPGGSKVTFRNIKKKVEPVEEKFEKIRKKKSKVRKVLKQDLNMIENDVSGFIDLTYFKRYLKISSSFSLLPITITRLGCVEDESVRACTVQ